MSDQVMPSPLRVVAVSWGLVELLGFLFTTGSALLTVFIAYSILPPVALLLCGLIPARCYQSRWAKLGLVFVLLAAAIRRVDSIWRELMDTPPYFLAAGLQLATLIILLALATHILKGIRTAPVTARRDDV
jgi:hypothetical protein